MRRNVMWLGVWTAVVALAFVQAGAVRAGEMTTGSGDAGAHEILPQSPADPQRAAVIAVIQTWVDAVNRKDGAAVSAPWAAEATIVDSVPPYQWQGPQAASAWWADYTALANSQGLTDIKFVFESRYIDLVGDVAYVVGDAHVDYRLKTGSMRDVATWTFCLVRRGDQWLLTAWAWGHLDRVATATTH